MTAAVLSFSLVLFGLVVWHARSGPLDLTEFLPYLQSAIKQETGAEMTAGQATLAWDDKRHRLAIRLSQVEVSARGAKSRLDAMDVSYRIPALLRGIYLPTEVVIHRPRFVLTRGKNGNITLQIGASSNTGNVSAVMPTPPLEDEGAAPFDLKSILAPLLTDSEDRFDAIDIVDAEASIIDIPNNHHFSIPALNAGLTRTNDGLDVNADFSTLISGTTAHYTANLSYTQTPARLDAKLTFQDLVPNMLAQEFQSLEDLEGAVLPLSGSIVASLPLPNPQAITLDDVIHASIQAEITGANGVVIAPEPYGIAYPIKGLRFKGSYDGIAQQAFLETLHVDLKDARLSVKAEAAWNENAGDAKISPSDIEIKATAHLNDTKLDRFEEYWPPGISESARTWITENLEDGEVTSSTFNLTLKGNDLTSIDATAFSGEAKIRNASVHYLRPMPPIKNLNGNIVFGMDTITAYPDSGRAGNLSIPPGGKIIFSGLAGDIQYADIDAHIVGPVRDALELLDNKPLRLISKMGKIDPKAISGDGDTHLTMHFPLLLELKLVDMTVNANATIKNAAIKNVIPGRNLHDGTLNLAVDLDQLAIHGDAKVNGVPLKLGWDERFSGKGPLTHYSMSGAIDDAGRKALGLDFIPFIAPYMRGTLIADAGASVDQKGIMTLDVQMDLTQTAMSVPGMGWRKLQGGEASGTASVRFNRDLLMDIPQFHAHTANGLEITGIGKANNKGQLTNITLRDISLGRSRLKGEIRFPASGGFDATLHGPVLDLQPMIGDSDWKTLVEDEAKPSASPVITDPARINVITPHTWVSKKGSVQNLHASLYRGRDGKWSGKVDGMVNGGKKLTIDARRVTGARHVKLSTENAGAFLSTFDFTDTIRSGSLSLDAQIPDNDDPIAGTVHIENFNVVDTPILARLISVASLTGIADLINDTGVTFWTLDAPFSVQKDLIGLKDFKAAGPSFGINGSGVVNSESHAVGLKGKLIPFNAVNQVISDIPLIGDLFGGKEGGFLAMDYSIKGTLEEPDASVNPLTALIPGGVQKALEGDKGKKEKKKPDGPESKAQ